MPHMSTSDEPNATAATRTPGEARPGQSQASGGTGRAQADAAGALETLGRSSGPASLILSSLADGPKHGYALTKDIESFAHSPQAPCTRRRPSPTA
jgi:hypothetical protein